MIEISKEGSGNYCFELKTRDGHTLLRSIEFPTREAAEKVLEKLPVLMEEHVTIERKTNHQGKFLFQLKDVNGSILGSSQLYSSEAGMENGIKNLKNIIISFP